MQMNLRGHARLLAMLWLWLCASGCAGALVTEADKLYSAGKYAESARLYEEACQDWHVEGCRDLATVLRHKAGKQLKPDGKKLRWAANRACLKGDAVGCRHLAYTYEHGFGGEANLDNALILYRRVCDASVWDGCEDGAAILINRKTSESVALAARMYARACDGGQITACAELGYQLYRLGGDKIEADPKRVLALLNRSCQGDQTFGCSYLALTLLQGNEGYPQDRPRGLSLLKRGCFEQRSGYDCWRLATQNDVSGKPLESREREALFERACMLGERRSCGKYWTHRLKRADASDKREVAVKALKACGAEYNNPDKQEPICLAQAHLALGERRAAWPLLERACARGDQGSCGALSDAIDTLLPTQTRQLDSSALAFRQGCEKGATRACLEWVHVRLRTASGRARLREFATPGCEARQEQRACWQLGMLAEYEHKQRAQGAPRDREAEALTRARLRMGCPEAQQDAHCGHVVRYTMFLAHRYKDPAMIAEARAYISEISKYNLYWRGDMANYMVNGKGLIFDKDERGGVALLEQLCERERHGVACANLVIFLRKGRGGYPSNPAREEALLTRGCTLGFDGACYMLARDYRFGCRARQDRARAVRYMDKLCAGHSGWRQRACFASGYLYTYGGVGLSANITTAQARYERACQYGHVASCRNKGINLSRGRAGKARIAEGCAIVKRACEQRNGGACYHYGSCVERLVGRDAPDEQLELLYYNKACKLGHDDGCVSAAMMQERGAAGMVKRVDLAVKVYEAHCTIKKHAGCVELARLAERTPTTVTATLARTRWWRARSCLFNNDNGACLRWARDLKAGARAGEALELLEFTCARLENVGTCETRDALRKAGVIRKPVVLPPAPTTGGIGADGAAEIQKAMQERLTSGLCK